MGRAVVYQLAKRGLRVLGLEQCPEHANLGSSASPSRGFRKAYPQRTYAELAQAAERAWRALEQDSGQELLRATGALSIASADHPAYQAMLKSLAEYGLPYHVLEGAAIGARYPALRMLDRFSVIVEEEAGILFSDRANDAALGIALRHGAEVHFGETAIEVTGRSDELRVRTLRDGARTEYSAEALVVCMGAWLDSLRKLDVAGELELDLPLQIERQVELWFEPKQSGELDIEHFPLFHVLFDNPERAFYGIPSFGAHGVKVCRQHGGVHTTADAIDRSLLPEDEAQVRAFMRENLPSANGRLLTAKVCMNTNTPDRHFILGAHPKCPRIFVAGGFSGHGYKFAPLIGEIMADLVTQGATRYPIAPFAPDRWQGAAT